MGDVSHKPKKIKVKLEKVAGETDGIVRLTFENKDNEEVGIVSTRAFIGDDSQPHMNLFLFRPGGIVSNISPSDLERKNSYSDLEYTILKPGEKIVSRDINLADYYDLPENYKVSYFASHPRSSFTDTLTLVSNAVTFGEKAQASNQKTIRTDDDPFLFGFPKLPEFPKFPLNQHTALVGAGIAAGVLVALKGLKK